MTLGAILIGVALATVVLAYLAQPFRVVNVSDDQAIEAWVARVREKKRMSGGAGEQGSREAAGINFCPQCGRHVEPDDRFCAGCGRQLQ